MNFIERGKSFIRKHQKAIILIGGVTIGVAATIVVYKIKKGEIKVIEKLPEWAEKWKEKCNLESLIYENGLPIFANPEQTIVYRDAVVEEVLSDPEFLEAFTIIDRS